MRALFVLVVIFTAGDCHYNQNHDSQHDFDSIGPNIGICPKKAHWRELDFICYHEKSKMLDFDEAIQDCLSDNNDISVDGIYSRLMEVGKLRHFINRYAHDEEQKQFSDLPSNSTERAAQMAEWTRKVLRNEGPFRINAKKTKEGKWREFPSGREIYFHHFPDFNPKWGKPGDTLQWFPRTNELKTVNMHAKRRTLCYRAKEAACHVCKGEIERQMSCFNSGDRWRDMCHCDDMFSGVYCEVPPPPRDRKVLMIATGVSSDDNVELYNFVTDKSCKGPQYPDRIKEPVATFIYERVVVCGGAEYASSTSIDKCYEFEPHKQLWMPIQDMRERRVDAEGTNLHNSFWVTGGKKTIPGSNELVHRTTEIFTKEGYWSQGPDMPTDLHRHCVVNINSCETAVIGKIVDHDNTGPIAVHIYNWFTETWRTGPQIVEVSSNHNTLVCERLLDPSTMNPLVVMYGDANVSPDVWDTVTDDVTQMDDAKYQLPASGGQLKIESISDFELTVIHKTRGIYTFSISEGLKHRADFITARQNRFVAVMMPAEYMICTDEEEET